MHDHNTAAPPRRIPANEEAEQALLGALLVNNRAFEKVADFLRPEHFYDPGHQKIYAAIAEHVEQGRTANPITLAPLFRDDPLFADEGGGQAYLMELFSNVVTVVNAADYGKTIHETFLRRQMIEVAMTMLDDAYGATGDEPEALIARCASDLDTLLDTAPSGGATFTTMREAAAEAVERAAEAQRNGGGLSGIATGLIDLDRITGGLQPTDLVILAGRPSMGKTTLAKNIGVHCAKRAKAGLPNAAPVGFISLEMSAQQLAANFLAEETGIATPRQRQGDLADHEFSRLAEVDSDIPFYVDTTADSIQLLVSRARRMKRKHGIGLLIVDYIQLMHQSGGKAENRVQEISAITRSLKKLAKGLELPIVALSQLSRQVENREDKHPQLSDLRESGSIEQDADVVMFCYREQYYLERAEPSRRADESEEKFNDRYQRWQQRLGEAQNIAEVIVAKQRMGALGVARTHFDGAASKFSDLDTRHAY